jgi:hypothetical protein
VAVVVFVVVIVGVFVVIVEVVLADGWDADSLGVGGSGG